MAAERIGATIICRDDIPEELCFAIRKSKADTAFVMDYTSKEDEELFRATTPMTRMIKISPYDYADKDAMPEYTEKEIASRYSKNTETTEGNLTWKEFLELGKDYHEDYMAERNPDRPVFGAYTSGSTEFQNWSSIPLQMWWQWHSRCPSLFHHQMYRKNGGFQFCHRH